MSYFGSNYFGSNYYANNYWGGVVTPVPPTPPAPPIVVVSTGGGYYAPTRQHPNLLTRIIDDYRQRQARATQIAALTLQVQLRDDEEVLMMLSEI